MPEALEEPVPASGEVATATRRPAAGFDTPPPSSRERKPVVVVDYRNDPRYKKKKTRSASKDDDAVFAAKSDSSVASGGRQVRDEHVDDTTQLTRSGSLRDDVPPAPQPRFSGGVGNPRVSAEPGTDSEGRVSPPPVVYSASSQQLSASFLLAANCDVADAAAAAAASPHQVSLKDMFKTIDPTTSPFC